MNRLFAFLMALFPALSLGQKIDTIPSRVNLGLNLATLISGIPEPQAEYYLNRYVDAFAAGGYTVRPVEGFIKVKDNVHRESLNGAYWKVGIKFRLFRPDKRVPIPWIQLLYIGSQYNERGTVFLLDTSGSGYKPTTVAASGIVHGGAIAVGADFRAAKHLIIRVGFQSGYYKRNDALATVLSYQPGFGCEGMLMPEQMMICLMYRLGSVL